MSELTQKAAKQQNAFNWRSQPSQIDWHGKSARQVILDATRQNREVVLGVFAPPAKAQTMPRPSPAG